MKYISFTCLIPFFMFCSCRKDDEIPQTKKISYVALGDSYTYGLAVPQSESFPFQLSYFLDREPYIEVSETKIIAQGGWTTSVLLNALEAESFNHSYDVVTLLIGTNNQYQETTTEEYKDDFRSLLLKAIELAGNNKSGVIVLSLPDHGFTPFGKPNQVQISQKIDTYNAVNKQLTDSLGATYIDVTSISRSGKSGLVSFDGLHPSVKVHALWANKIYLAVRNRILDK